MLSQSSTYAIIALAQIAAGGGEPVLIKRVARACRSPAPYLAKIINLLARKKLVLTRRGVGGGVVLARPPREMTLYEVCEALDDEVLHPRCLLGHVACTGERSCPAHSFCVPTRQRLANFLRRTTIADITAFEARLQRLAPEALEPPAAAKLKAES